MGRSNPAPSSERGAVRHVERDRERERERDEGRQRGEEQKLLKSPAPCGCLCATNSRSEPYSACRDRLFGCIHTSCLADAQLCTCWAIDRSCTVLMCTASVE